METKEYLDRLLDELYDSLQFCPSQDERIQIKKLIEKTKEKRTK